MKTAKQIKKEIEELKYLLQHCRADAEEDNVAQQSFIASVRGRLQSLKWVLDKKG